MADKTALEKTRDAIKGLFAGSKSSAASSKPPVRKFEDTGKNAGDAIRKHNADMEAAGKDLKAYKRGGVVKKTGPAKLHAKERVLTVKQTQKLDKKPAVKKAIGLKTKKV